MIFGMKFVSVFTDYYLERFFILKSIYNNNRCKIRNYKLCSHEKLKLYIII
jgi:hypothetical protein